MLLGLLQLLRNNVVWHYFLFLIDFSDVILQLVKLVLAYQRLTLQEVQSFFRHAALLLQILEALWLVILEQLLNYCKTVDLIEAARQFGLLLVRFRLLLYIARQVF